MMSDYLPLFKPGEAVTYTASAAVVGGTLVELTTAGSVGPGTAGSDKIIGVAGFDSAIGEKVTVYRGGVQRLIAASSISVGDRVASALGGEIAEATAGQLSIGIAQTAGDDGDLIEVVWSETFIPDGVGGSGS